MINTSEDIQKQQYSEVALLTLRQDGIITFEPKEGKTEHNLPAMKEEINIFIDWANGEKLGFLCDNRNLKKFDSDVKVFAQQNLHHFCNKFAVIVSSGISSVLTNFFIHLNRPDVPIKMFTNEEKALDWLKEGKNDEVIFNIPKPNSFSDN